MTNKMLMEDWLRGCVHHDGRNGYVTLPCDEVMKIADYIESTRTKVEVVRCRDCVHCADDYVDTGFGAMPAFTCDIFEGYGVGIKPDHYCSYGEQG